MSQYDKMVKMACKPKNAPPKPKYVDPLVAATFSDDGSLQDITRSISLRLREPNPVVIFKALLILHMMIRTGSTENLLGSLASSSGDPLRLRNIGNTPTASGAYEGYSPPSNMGMYALYLDARIRCFKELKHDFVRMQTESNRRSDGAGANSKARRLRHLAVDKGLLREVKVIQRMLDALVVCRFYEDNLQDENTVIAFRMLIKDLLVLFQAGNEGVCNILEHYFEMSKSDATESFEIYKSFIKQTDRVVDYLSMARKLHNVVNIPVPNLKHAPTGLVRALEEYLTDPDFENNRVEYRKSLGVVEGRSTDREPSPAGNTSMSTPSKPAAAQNSTSASYSSALISADPAPAVSSAPPGASQKIQDFFDSIQANQQPTMFGGPVSNGFGQQQQQQQMQMQMQMQMPQFPFQQPQLQQQQPMFNPFRQSGMMPQQTGFMPPQMTGFPGQMGAGGGGAEFLQPQMTGQMAFGNQPFGQPQQQQQQQQPFAPSPQQPQQTGFLQPQGTGSNPFRQSMMLNTATTGMPGQSASGMGMGNMAISQPSSPSPFGSLNSANRNFGPTSPIQRPGSTPATLSAAGQGSLVAQPTGSKNPFAPAPGSITPASAQQQQRGPSMNELAASRFNPGPGTGAFGQQQQQQQQQQQGQGGAGNGAMGDIASAFAFDQKLTSPTGPAGNDFMSQFGSLSVNTGATSPHGNGTGTNTPTASSLNAFGNAFGNGSGSVSPSPLSPGGSSQFLQPQKTGFGGSNIKPFKPSSSFGSQLMADLGSVPEAESPGVNTTGGGGAGSGGMSQFGTFRAGSGTGQVSAGSMGGAGGGSNNGGGGGGGGNPNQFGQFGQLSPQMTGSNPFRQSMFNSLGPQGTGGGGGGAFGAGSPFSGQNTQLQQQNRPFGQMQQGQGQGPYQGQGQGGSLI